MASKARRVRGAASVLSVSQEGVFLRDVSLYRRLSSPSCSSTKAICVERTLFRINLRFFVANAPGSIPDPRARSRLQSTRTYLEKMLSA